MLVPHIFPLTGGLQSTFTATDCFSSVSPVFSVAKAFSKFINAKVNLLAMFL
jgi:hypothetical protein